MSAVEKKTGSLSADATCTVNPNNLTAIIFNVLVLRAILTYFNENDTVQNICARDARCHLAAPTKPSPSELGNVGDVTVYIQRQIDIYRLPSTATPQLEKQPRIYACICHHCACTVTKILTNV